MTRVTIHVAKTTLSKLIALAVAGEDVVISRGATPVVRLVPWRSANRCARLGLSRAWLP